MAAIRVRKPVLSSRLQIPRSAISLNRHNGIDALNINRTTLGTAAFAVGAAAIIVSSWLVMWWIWPIWHETPAAEFEGTIWAFGGPVFMAISLSTPTGLLLVAIGALLRSGSGGPSGRRLIALIGFAALIWLSFLVAPTLAYVPVMFGVGGGLILILFFGTLWQWTRTRGRLSDNAATAADLSFAGLLCFFAVTPLLCALLGNPYSGLYFPERVIEQNSLPWHYAMGTKILLLLVLGWGCMFLSQRVAGRDAI